MNQPFSLNNAPQHLDEVIEGFVTRDLLPPRSVVHLKVGIAAIAGGLLSLALCGQFGIGFTSFAVDLSSQIHDHLGPVPCALLCGTLYAIFPVALLRFVLCTTLQFKGILRRHQLIVALWFGGVGTILASAGHHGADLLGIGLWLSAALASTFVGARLTESLSWSRALPRSCLQEVTNRRIY